ncbi:hypothetical protein D3C76_1600330 [compost metagenome]
MLVGAVDMPAKGIHLAQHATLLAVGRHLQQGLSLQLVDHIVQLLLLRLHGLAQGGAVGDGLLQFAEVVAQAL